MPAKARAIGIDIGGSTTKVAALSSRGEVAHLLTIPTQSPVEVFIDRLTTQVAEVRQVTGDTRGIGVSVAGFVDEARAAMFYNPNLPWLERYPLRRALTERTGLPVSIDADSNAACLAEYRFGIGRDSRRFLCLTLGTGVGGGMLVDGNVVRVAHGGLGDLGHVIVDPSGAGVCTAGCHGCAEALISTSAIEARWPGDPALTTREIISAAQAGDQRAIAVLAHTGRLLGIALATYVAILFPDTIVIAGGIAEAGELLVAPARESLRALAGDFPARGLRVEKAALGWQAPLAGSVLPLFDRD